MVYQRSIIINVEFGCIKCLDTSNIRVHFKLVIILATSYCILNDSYNSNYLRHWTVRGRSQLSTFMKAYTAYARGEGVWDHRTLSPENQHLFLITDNVL